MPTSFVTIIGGAIAVAFLLAFVIVTIWIYHRKHPSTPPRRHGSRSSLASQASLGEMHSQLFNPCVLGHIIVLGNEHDLLLTLMVCA